MKTRKFYFSVICCALALVLCVSSVPVQAAQKADVNTALARANASAASTLSAIHADTNLADEMKIRQIITLLFDIKRDIFANEGLYDFDFSLFGEVNETKGADLLYFARSVQAQAALFAGLNITLADAQTDLTFKSLDITGNTATCNVYEWFSYHMVTPAEGKEPEESGRGIPYEISLQKIGNNWNITGIDFFNITTDQLKDSSISVSSFVENACEAAKAPQESTVLSTFGDQAAFDDGVARSNIIYLNRDLFKAYALDFDGAFRNPYFYDYTNDGGDCQNFASQCVWAGLGGNTATVSSAPLPMINATLAGGTGRAWYSYPNGAHSPSWTSCYYFRNYVSSGSSSTLGLTGVVYSGVAYAKVGDILHLQTAPGEYGHAYVVVAVDPDSVEGAREACHITVSAHTCDVSYEKLCCTAPGGEFKTIRLLGLVTG